MHLSALARGGAARDRVFASLAAAIRVGAIMLEVERAQVALERLLSVGSVRIQRHGKAVYRRTLANVTVDGRDVGAVLVERSLPRKWR